MAHREFSAATHCATFEGKMGMRVSGEMNISQAVLTSHPNPEAQPEDGSPASCWVQ